MSLIPGAGKCVRFIMGQRVSAVDARRRYPYIPADFPGCWLVSGVAWRGGREAEGAGLLNQYTGNCIVGSNPIPSAIHFRCFRSVSFSSDFTGNFRRLAAAVLW